MGLWKWEGFDKNGKKSRGQIQAKDERSARKSLRSNGVRVRTLIAPSLLEFDFNEWMLEEVTNEGSPVTVTALSYNPDDNGKLIIKNGSGFAVRNLPSVSRI